MESSPFESRVTLPRFAVTRRPAVRPLSDWTVMSPVTDVVSVRSTDLPLTRMSPPAVVKDASLTLPRPRTSMPRSAYRDAYCVGNATLPPITVTLPSASSSARPAVTARLPTDMLPLTLMLSPFRASSREPLVTLPASSVPIVTSPPTAMKATSSSRWMSPSTVTDFVVMLPAEKTPHSVSSSSWSTLRSPFKVTP